MTYRAAGDLYGHSAHLPKFAALTGVCIALHRRAIREQLAGIAHASGLRRRHTQLAPQQRGSSLNAPRQHPYSQCTDAN